MGPSRRLPRSSRLARSRRRRARSRGPTQRWQVRRSCSSWRCCRLASCWASPGSFPLANSCYPAHGEGRWGRVLVISLSSALIVGVAPIRPVGKTGALFGGIVAGVGFATVTLWVAAAPTLSYLGGDERYWLAYQGTLATPVGFGRRRGSVARAGRAIAREPGTDLDGPDGVRSRSDSWSTYGFGRHPLRRTGSSRCGRSPWWSRPLVSAHDPIGVAPSRHGWRRSSSVSAPHSRLPGATESRPAWKSREGSSRRSEARWIPTSSSCWRGYRKRPIRCTEPEPRVWSSSTASGAPAASRRRGSPYGSTYGRRVECRVKSFGSASRVRGLRSRDDYLEEARLVPSMRSCGWLDDTWRRPVSGAMRSALDREDTHYLALAPLSDGSVITAAVPPRRGLAAAFADRHRVRRVGPSLKSR